jgi:hypothetical protein
MHVYCKFIIMLDLYLFYCNLSLKIGHDHVLQCCLDKDQSFIMLTSCIRLLSYGPPWAHCIGGYQDRLLGGPLGLPGLRYTAPEGVEHKDYTGVVLG